MALMSLESSETNGNFPTQLREVTLSRTGAAYYNHGDIVMIKYRGKKR